jgi:S1-C subfamily serine protease
MGANLHEPEGEELSAYGLDFNRRGVALVNVPEQSVAWQKGFRPGDFITAVDGQEVEGIKSFLRIVDGKYAPGSSPFHLYRDQKKMQIRVYW